VFNEFPERLNVESRDNFLQNSFDIYYEAPSRSLIPCSHKCKDKENCAHPCCHKYGLNVKVQCTDRSGDTYDYVIVLSEEATESII
jgi:hypothetical protein